ncbi:hypothetical protein [Candidatus Nitrosotenuis aquarius]|uniref:hypothetical protein n=1 Tax=Candidatus Nitrosotenuis aquarius TaxID=1846278 RepID=UPI000C1F4722|nr:hypothetical protein [Candidatus Nitrosotenuis aquarius]
MDDKTKEIIAKYSPMMNMTELEEFEDNNILKFDVKLRQKDAEKTIYDGFGNDFEDTDLRSLANNIYDDLSLGYELWIRKSSKSSIDKTMSHDVVRYVMTLEADNMLEDGFPLSFRMVNEWLVISSDEDGNVSDDNAKQFYRLFDMDLE